MVSAVPVSDVSVVVGIPFVIVTTSMPVNVFMIVMGAIDRLPNYFRGRSHSGVTR